MITKDFHFHNTEDAINEMHHVVGQIRSAGKTEEVYFITGHGTIKPALIEALKEYGLKPTTLLGNTGTILCLIE